jgi:hypothetical protein
MSKKVHMPDQKQSKHKTDFKTEVITKLETLYKNGISIDDKTYTINKVITIYVKNMKVKFNSLGTTYLHNMVLDIENIINNLTIKSNYDNLEYVNNILNYCINILYYKHNKINSEPTIPDYTLAEIKDMGKNI